MRFLKLAWKLARRLGYYFVVLAFWPFFVIFYRPPGNVAGALDADDERRRREQASSPAELSPHLKHVARVLEKIRKDQLNERH